MNQECAEGERICDLAEQLDVPNVVVISDTHGGCGMGLMHPDGAELDEGGSVMPSPLQLKMWAWWEEWWRDIVPSWTRGDKFAVVHNGDVIDGVHHNSTTQWSHNLLDQRRHMVKVLTPVVERCQGRYFQIKGTEAHVGKSAVEEEQVAKDLGAIKDEFGRSSRWDMWYRMPDGLVHFLHHIGTTSSAQHETSALNAELSAMYTDAGRFGDEPPRIVVRSHRHQSSEASLPVAYTRRDGIKVHGKAAVIVTPAWQLKTPHAWKIAGARVRQPQLGGAVIRQTSEELFTRIWVVRMDRSQEVSFG